ncbi:hypothetical protein [Lapillicoccus jejuensis]|uniref:hypothetical protein n=1 Tax=Lapillicoccus jejuensis TaxID=402171 RepID=UPI0011504131|nr:hypothetical protein [Lapillicoccus jejuensis]
MAYDPNTWGSIAEWASGAGTVGALGVAVNSYRKDVDDRRRSQAKLVALVGLKADSQPVDPSFEFLPEYFFEEPFTYTLHNLSNQPIYAVRFARYSDEGQLSIIDNGYVDGPRRVGTLMPAESTQIRVEPLHAMFLLVLYRDNAGHTWLRDPSGKLEQLTRTRQWIADHEFAKRWRRIQGSFRQAKWTVKQYLKYVSPDRHRQPGEIRFAFLEPPPWYVRLLGQKRAQQWKREHIERHPSKYFNKP